MWPFRNVCGCQFHLVQSWFRMILVFGASMSVPNTDSGRSFFKNIFDFLFLKAEYVHDYLIDDFMPNLLKDIPILQFIDYVHDTYVVDGCLFPPIM